MSGAPTDEERLWAAEKQSFVAEARDGSTDEREAAADAHEALVDAREAQLDEFAGRLAASALAIGHPTSATDQQLRDGADVRARARAERGAARAEREEARRLRGAITAHLEQPLNEGSGDGPPLLLAAQFAEIASYLYTANSLSEVLERITHAAVLTVPGCRYASVTICDTDGCHTIAATDDNAAAVDRAQYEVGEGPCLDALRLPKVHVRSFPDERWPVLGDRPLAFGVHSLVAYHLDTTPDDLPVPGAKLPCAGALNIFGDVPEAFDQEARNMGLVLAAHASIAAHVVSRRHSLEGLSRNLQEALSALPNRGWVGDGAG
ncbi:MAG: GAF domain-containing protein [Brooklawnia sp.]|uniref:GAF domain-containing protein n=1 Tax=Brooklawnia sp. TaxID=2699740 RepID=UPI003C7809B6